MAANTSIIEPGSTALVTGASGGIGEQFARHLATRGVHLVLAARSHERLERLAEELRASDGVSVLVVPVDLASARGADELVDTLVSRGVRIDLLINNAGIGSQGQFVDDDSDAVSRMIQLNSGALVTLTRRLLPSMVERGRGGVINVASTAGFQPVATMAVYGASKAFVLSFTEALWAETVNTGVRVMALAPGATDTQFFATANPDRPFMTRGRQSPAWVAEFALRKFERGHGATVVPGAGNRLMANGYRFMPRSVIARMSARSVQPV